MLDDSRHQRGIAMGVGIVKRDLRNPMGTPLISNIVRFRISYLQPLDDECGPIHPRSAHLY